MSTAKKLGTLKAKSAPNVLGDSVWFQGENDLIWHMPLDKPEDAVNPQGLKTLSTPTPCDDGHVFFQGEGNTLVMMEQRFPHLYTIVAGVDCWSVPVAPNDGYVYYRTGAGTLARVSVAVADNFGAVTQYDASTAFAPAIHITANATYAFLADGTDYGLTRVDLDQANPTPADHGSHTLIDAPIMGNNGKLYIVDNKNDAYEMDVVTTNAIKLTSSVKSTPVTSEIVDDGKLYWRTIGDKLLMAPRDYIAHTTELGTTDARPDAQGDGFVYFLGEDEYLYRASTTAT